MTTANGRRVKSLWETFRDVVAVLSGLVFLAGFLAYIANTVFAYLDYIIICAMAIFLVSLAFMGGARLRRRRKETALEETGKKAQEEAKMAREVLEKTPVSVVRQGVTIGERDRIATGLRHMVIPLNKPPRDDWIHCFDNLPVVYTFLQETRIRRGSIETMASEGMVTQTVDALADLVQRTNIEYDKYLQETADRLRAETARTEAEKRRVRDLESRARDGEPDADKQQGEP